MNPPAPDWRVLVWKLGFYNEYDRAPTYKDLPREIKSIVGNSIHECLKYRDLMDKNWPDRLVYHLVYRGYGLEPPEDNWIDRMPRSCSKCIARWRPQDAMRDHPDSYQCPHCGEPYGFRYKPLPKENDGIH